MIISCIHVVVQYKLEAAEAVEAVIRSRNQDSSKAVFAALLAINKTRRR